MKTDSAPGRITRRDLLARSSAFGITALVIGPAFVAGHSAAWALDLKHLSPETMATLIQMARDIYPHDRIPDEFYAIAVKSYDTEGNVAEIEQGISDLNKAAVAAGYPSYVEIGWERDRAAILRSIESTTFFQTIRGGLVTGLYNQKEVWPVFGYEGESFSKGGYMTRGFDDINWL